MGSLLLPQSEITPAKALLLCNRDVIWVRFQAEIRAYSGVAGAIVVPVTGVESGLKTVRLHLCFL
jgi:hypothetical protein